MGGCLCLVAKKPSLAPYSLPAARLRKKGSSRFASSTRRCSKRCMTEGLWPRPPCRRQGWVSHWTGNADWFCPPRRMTPSSIGKASGHAAAPHLHALGQQVARRHVKVLVEASLCTQEATRAQVQWPHQHRGSTGCRAARDRAHAQRACAILRHSAWPATRSGPGVSSTAVRCSSG